MKIDADKLLAGFPQVAKHPRLVITILALAVPLLLLYGATKFVSAPMPSIVLFSLLGISALVYSAWIFTTFQNTPNGK